jgi:hypothetical protein
MKTEAHSSEWGFGCREGELTPERGANAALRAGGRVLTGDDANKCELLGRVWCSERDVLRFQVESWGGGSSGKKRRSLRCELAAEVDGWDGGGEDRQPFKNLEAPPRTDGKLHPGELLLGAVPTSSSEWSGLGARKGEGCESVVGAIVPGLAHLGGRGGVREGDLGGADATASHAKPESFGELRGGQTRATGRGSATW